MGLLFQPRWSGHRLTEKGVGQRTEVASDRRRVYVTALETLMVGDTALLADLFTADVAFSSPHVVVDSLTSLRREVGSPEDALSEIEITLVSLDIVGDKVFGEWRLNATFTRPVLYDDRLLIEPTGGAVRLSGASVAEFRGPRICAFRHYFDDSELLAGVPGSSTHLRWSIDD